MNVESEVGPVVGVSGTCERTTLKGKLSVYPLLLIALTMNLKVLEIGPKDWIVYCLREGRLPTMLGSTLIVIGSLLPVSLKIKKP